MKKIIYLLFILILTGCSSSNYKTINIEEDPINIIRPEVSADIMNGFYISGIPNSHDNYFEEKGDIKIYEYNLEKGILQKIIEPIDNSWQTSFNFKPHQMKLEDFLETEEKIKPELKKVYIEQDEKYKIIITSEGNKIKDVYLKFLNQ